MMRSDRLAASAEDALAAAAPEAGAPVRVMTVDDQPVFRRAAAELVASTDGFRHVGAAGSGREALQIAADLDPDLVLLDVRMPGMDGIETARRMAVAHPRAIVVLISLEGASDLPAAAASAGAAAHVRKQDLSPEALRELWRVHGRAASG